jgi:arylsulfatase A-like enzyme
MLKWSFIAALVGTLCIACNDYIFDPPDYQTEYVVVLVIDGPRYSETWGDTSRQYIPYMDSAMEPNCFMHDYFYNNGTTNTTTGHTAITTGHYQTISNSGLQLPDRPSFFQHYLKWYPDDTDLVWLLTSKDKLEVLANCADQNWKDKYQPSHDCGVNGLNSGYRHDSITYEKAINLISTKHPKILFIQFREPDYSGHTGNWNAYLDGIRNTDKYAYQIWQFIQNDPIYQNKTTLFITNDHGRHLDGVAGGFPNHGDNCDGCKRISLMSLGPDFKKGHTSVNRSLVDLHATILHLLGLNNVPSEGEVMVEIFK